MRLRKLWKNINKKKDNLFPGNVSDFDVPDGFEIPPSERFLDEEDYYKEEYVEDNENVG